ncbi:MAG: hypothetical protein GF401_05070 [Chitinivibrionales bacterium]|nr:hypothetical protein [Chitinivibrionales bacterium]
MKNKNCFLHILIFCTLLSATESDTASDFEPEYITADSLFALTKNDTEFVLIDARSAKEYEKTHIKGALNIPHTEVNSSKRMPPDKDTLIVFYCNGPG